MRGKCALFATIPIWQIEIIIPILRKERTFLYKSQSRVSSHANPFADKFDSSCLFLANRLIDLDFIPIHLVDIIFQWRAFRNVQFTQFHRGNNYTWIVLRRCFLFNLNLIARRTWRSCCLLPLLDVVTTLLASMIIHTSWKLKFQPRDEFISLRSIDCNLIRSILLWNQKIRIFTSCISQKFINLLYCL